MKWPECQTFACWLDREEAPDWRLQTNDDEVWVVRLQEPAVIQQIDVGKHLLKLGGSEGKIRTVVLSLGDLHRGAEGDYNTGLSLRWGWMVIRFEKVRMDWVTGGAVAFRSPRSSSLI